MCPYPMSKYMFKLNITDSRTMDLAWTQACSFIKKEAVAQVFSCEFCEIFKNTFFTLGHPQWLLLYLVLQSQQLKHQNRFHTLFWWLHCSFWTSKCLLGKDLVLVSLLLTLDRHLPIGNPALQVVCFANSSSKWKKIEIKTMTLKLC